jgi:Rad3-related DNA helicase
VQETSLEYICLDPAVTINRMSDLAAKLILTSGTLEPAGDFELIKATKHKFSCGHVVKPE